MTRSLESPKFTIKTAGDLINTLTDGSKSKIAHPAVSYAPALADGVSAGQCNRAWQAKSRTLSSGDIVTIDVNDFEGFNIGGGNGNDALGQAMDLEKIVSIVITNDNAVGAAGILEVYPSASEGWTPIGTHTIATEGALHGQSCIAKINPSATAFDVTDVSHRITLRATSGDVTFSAYIQGRSDDEESSSQSSRSSSSSNSSSNSSSLSSSSSNSSSSSSLSSSSLSSSSSSISTSSSSSSSSSSISTSSLSSSSISTSSSSISTSSSSISTSSSSSSVSTSSSSSSISTSSSSSSVSTSSSSSSSSSSQSSSSLSSESSISTSSSSVSTSSESQ